MKDKTKNEGRLKLALSILNKQQASEYSKLCGSGKLITLDRLNIATSLFDDRQTNKFAARIATHEGFRMPPKSCKGGDCCGCKTGKRIRCIHYIQIDIKPQSSIRKKRKK